MLTPDQADSTEPKSSDQSSAAPGIDVRSLVMRHGSWASLGTACSLAFALLSTVVLARILSPSDFARFTLTRLAVGFLGTLAAFGLGTTALKHLGHFHADATPFRRRQLLSTLFRVATVTLLTTGLVGAALALQFGETLTGGQTGIVIASLIGMGTIMGGILTITSDSIRGVGALASANMLGNIMQGSPILHIVTLGLVSVAYVFRQPTWWEAVAAFSAGCTVAAGAGCWILVRQLRTPADRGAKAAKNQEPFVQPNIAQIISASWPMAALSTIVFLIGSGDLFLTSRFAAPESIPAYIAARRTILILGIPMTVLNTAARGIVSPLYSANMTDQLQRSLRAGGGLVAIPCLVAAAITMMAPEVVLNCILGPGYAEAAPLLQILVPGQVVFVMTGCCGTLLNLTGHQRTTMWINAVAAIFLVVAGPWVASRFGAIGLAIQMTFLLAFVNAVTWAVAMRVTGINTLFSFKHLSGWREFSRRGTVTVAEQGSNL